MVRGIFYVIFVLVTVGSLLAILYKVFRLSPYPLGVSVDLSLREKLKRIFFSWLWLPFVLFSAHQWYLTYYIPKTVTTESFETYEIVESGNVFTPSVELKFGNYDEYRRKSELVYVKGYTGKPRLEVEISRVDTSKLSELEDFLYGVERLEGLYNIEDIRVYE